MKTLADLRNKCYNILREEENSNAYPYSLVDDLINSAQQKIASGLVINPLNQMEVHKGQLPFLNAEVFYKTYLTKYVSEDVEAGASSIPMDTEGYPSEGYVYILGSIIQYRSKDANNLLQCTGVLGGIKAGSQLSIVHKVPTDYMNPVNCIMNDIVQLDIKEYDDIFEAMRDNKGNADYRYLGWRGYDKPFYCIKDDTYIIFYNINVESQIRLRYEKIPAPMIYAEDECCIPSDIYSMSVIPYLAVGETMYNRGEEQRGAEVINFGMGQLREMYQYYNKTGIERMTSKNYKMAKSRFNI